MIVKTLILPLLLVVTTNASWAYTSTLMDGDILEKNSYNFNFETQYIDQKKGSGLNFNGRFDLPFNQDINLRALLGFGETDFHVGGLIKWMPIPDYERQPAIGLLTGFQYAKLGSVDEFALRLTPYLSKKVSLSVGQLAPYISLPIAISIIDSETEVPLQFQIGTELEIKQLKNYSFFAEIGLNINESFTFFSLGLTYNYNRM